ncbi:MAG: hypothetical protein HY619_02125 [Thaumarchaeota archaeon]|nr:hypothetical protein [Nitrososphaerota archaeon]
MSTSVKLSEEDKKRLEKLQATVTLKGGEKMTQQELLSRLISEALKKGDEFVEKLVKASVPLSDEEYGRVQSLVEDWGVETSWKDVDRLLYGTRTKKVTIKRAYS